MLLKKHLKPYKGYLCQTRFLSATKVRYIAFDEFYEENVVSQARDLDIIGEPKLPRYKLLNKFSGSDSHQFDEPKRYF